ncbi:hypothetical protein N7492_000193 [Penicillium capsulatum]|uniref:Uncharacterized protein n=1 Tax=Penicillium capsulatum TaxID=69766 RepID=A0A9W9IRD8_9EURO|nr:hypothetical protein N7492_000193 [Penicillium capsulatum]KAJ6130742.1 hypothetical protein N7512_003522 [Penicillium capsulatum]
MIDPPSPSDSIAAPPRITPAYLRRRGIPARVTLEGMPDWPQRRNSTLSDSISEARQSIRSSTDDLFLPRVAKGNEGRVATEESHWHSAPLGLALLPAIAGVFFQDGSSFVTDVTLLVLAAIFLNWSVRLPWDWYRSAQAVQREHADTVEMDLNELNEEDELDTDKKEPRQHHRRAAEAQAIKELQIHELTALASCFIFPIIGTWLLHAIRSSLSRPSEGLVSNYNLTIFLLASEVRPFAHLLKLVQARTLHLQRIVASASDEDRVDPSKVQDLTKRLEELEAHVAEAAATRLATSPSNPDQLSPTQETLDAPTLITQAAVEARKALQPDIEALNRAVRRYEKRTALSTLQSDTRFQQLEAQTRDAIALAAAAQRSTANRRSSYAFILIDWACAIVVVPAQIALSVLNFPGRVANRCLLAVKGVLHRRQPVPRKHTRPSKGKGVERYQSQAPPTRASTSALAQQSSSTNTRIEPR